MIVAMSRCCRCCMQCQSITRIVYVDHDIIPLSIWYSHKIGHIYMHALLRAMLSRVVIIKKLIVLLISHAYVLSI